MTYNPENRMATPTVRGQGRPPKSEPRLPSSPVVVDTMSRRVPAQVMKCCGRGVTPLLQRWRTEANYPKEVADCLCDCGRGGVYYPSYATEDGTVVVATYRLK